MTTGLKLKKQRPKLLRTFEPQTIIYTNHSYRSQLEHSYTTRAFNVFHFGPCDVSIQ
ncbi:hypothetical protein Hanom_Chr03g00190461 [Helianthus anomalus]